GECWRTRSASSTASVSSVVRPLAAVSSVTIRSLSSDMVAFLQLVVGWTSVLRHVPLGEFVDCPQDRRGRPGSAQGRPRGLETTLAGPAQPRVAGPVPGRAQPRVAVLL